MINKLYERIKTHWKIVENFSYLTVLQLFTSLVPVFTYPYLVHVLGIDLYGTVIFAQTIVSYFSLVVDFGFKSSAAKEVSIHRDNKGKLSEIISSVFYLRCFLWSICLILLIILIIIVPGLKENKLLYLFSFGFTLNELLLPQFYFIGTEKMKYVTILNIIVKTVFVSLIFVLIKTPADYLYVPVLNTIGFLAGGGIALYIVFIKERIRLVRPSLAKLKHYLLDAFPLFASDIIISVKDRFNVILIGTVLGMQEVAIYDLGMKIVNVLIKPLDILNTVIFPGISKDKNLHFLHKVIKISLLTAATVILLLQIPLHYVIEILSSGVIGNALPIRLMLFIPLIMAVSLPLARNYLIAWGYYKILFLGMLYTTLFYLVLILIGQWLGYLDNIIVFIFITLAVYVFELAYRIILYFKTVTYECKK